SPITVITAALIPTSSHLSSSRLAPRIAPRLHRSPRSSPSNQQLPFAADFYFHAPCPTCPPGTSSVCRPCCYRVGCFIHKRARARFLNLAPITSITVVQEAVQVHTTNKITPAILS